MSYGWQKSGECQSEMRLAYQRFKKKTLRLVPVQFPDFDLPYDDKEEEQQWSFKLEQIQNITVREEEVSGIKWWFGEILRAVQR